MSRSNVEEYSAADANPAALRSIVTLHVKRIREDPESLLKFLVPSLTNGDKRVVSDVAMRRLLAASYTEAVRDSPEGWIDDVVALRRPWGVDLSRVKAPVLLWHGADDMFSPVAHTHWLAKTIPGATLKVQPGAAHFEAVEILPGVLTWMKDPHRSERLWVKRAYQPALSS
jgi:pimeloyl-ACP methyl ester carboxylesterase